MTEQYPRLVAILQMMYLKEAELPCFVETKNVLKELENELFPLFHHKGLPQLLGKHLLSEPFEKKNYLIKVKGNKESVNYFGWLSRTENIKDEEIVLQIRVNKEFITLLVNVKDIEEVQSHIRVPADQISRDEFYEMDQVGRWDTLLLYVRQRLNRNLTTQEKETLFKMTEDVELTYQILQIIA